VTGTVRPAGGPLRVAAVGGFIVDVLGRPVASLPRGQTSHGLDEIRLTAAGTAGGTSVDLARLGAEVLAVGAIGSDLIGDFLVSALERQGIASAHLARKPGVQTSATILPIHPNGDRPAWHVRGANVELSLEDVPLGELGRCDAVHLGGLTALPALDGEPAAAVLRHARERGAVTTADCLGVKHDDALALVGRCLPYVDIFMPNEDEALAITGAPDAAAAAARLRELGAACVIVKRGADGCLIDDGDGQRAVPGFEVPVLDTTGCGDAFCAGVIVTFCAGWPIDHAALFGNAAGALTARGLGSDAGARDFDEALRFMREGPRATTTSPTPEALAAPRRG
jgi:sugar/nucleoside kinase (ribokinase family)